MADPTNDNELIGSALDEMVKERTDEDLTRSLVGAVGANPDQHAENLKLSKETGFPVDVVERNKDSILQQKAQDDAMVRAALLDDPAAIEWFKNKDNAKLVSDEPGFWPWAKKVYGQLPDAWDKGSGDVQLNILNHRASFGQLTPEEEAQRQALKAHQKSREDYTGDERGTATQAILGTAQTLPQLIDQGVGTAKGAVAGSAGGAIIGSVGGLPGAVTGAIRGGTIGGRLGGAMENFIQQQGAIYADLEDITNDDGQHLDKNVMLGASIVAGVPNAALDLLPFEKYLKTLPGIGPVLDKLGGKLTRENIKDAIKIPAVQRAMYNIGKRFGAAMAAEGFTEALQQVNEILVKEGAKALSDGDFEPITWAEAAAQTLEAGKGGMVIGGGIATPGSVMSIPGEIKRQRNLAPEQVKAHIEAINKAAPNDKLFQRSPDAFRDLVEKLAPGEKFYIAGEQAIEVINALPEEQKVALFKAVKNLQEQIDGFNEAGGYIEMSKADYATYIAPYPQAQILSDHIKLAVEDESFAEKQEAQEFAKNNPELAKQLYQGKPGTVPQEISQAIEHYVRKAMIAAGRSQQEARMSATLLAKMYSRFAAPLGKSATDFLQNYMGFRQAATTGETISEASTLGIMLAELKAVQGGKRVPGLNEQGRAALKDLGSRLEKAGMTAEEAERLGPLATWEKLYGPLQPPQDAATTRLEQPVDEEQPSPAHSLLDRVKNFVSGLMGEPVDNTGEDGDNNTTETEDGSNSETGTPLAENLEPEQLSEAAQYIQQRLFQSSDGKPLNELGVQRPIPGAIYGIPVFYSQLYRAIDALKVEQATAKEWRDLIISDASVEKKPLRDPRTNKDWTLDGFNSFFFGDSKKVKLGKHEYDVTHDTATNTFTLKTEITDEKTKVKTKVETMYSYTVKDDKVFVNEHINMPQRSPLPGVKVDEVYWSGLLDWLNNMTQNTRYEGLEQLQETLEVSRAHLAARKDGKTLTEGAGFSEEQAQNLIKEKEDEVALLEKELEFAKQFQNDFFRDKASRAIAVIEGITQGDPLEIANWMGGTKNLQAHLDEQRALGATPESIAGLEEEIKKRNAKLTEIEKGPLQQEKERVAKGMSSDGRIEEWEAKLAKAQKDLANAKKGILSKEDILNHMKAHRVEIKEHFYQEKIERVKVPIEQSGEKFDRSEYPSWDDIEWSDGQLDYDSDYAYEEQKYYAENFRDSNDPEDWWKDGNTGNLVIAKDPDGNELEDGEEPPEGSTFEWDEDATIDYHEEEGINSAQNAAPYYVEAEINGVTYRAEYNPEMDSNLMYASRDGREIEGYSHIRANEEAAKAFILQEMYENNDIYDEDYINEREEEWQEEREKAKQAAAWEAPGSTDEEARKAFDEGKTVRLIVHDGDEDNIYMKDFNREGTLTRWSFDEVLTVRQNKLDHMDPAEAKFIIIEPEQEVEGVHFRYDNRKTGMVNYGNESYRTEGGEELEYGELVFHLPNISDAGVSQHSWRGVRNVVMHMRFTVRKDVDGKPVFFIEEMQSDWHQDGREKGYKNPEAEKAAAKAQEKRDAFYEKKWRELLEAAAERIGAKVQERENAYGYEFIGPENDNYPASTDLGNGYKLTYIAPNTVPETLHYVRFKKEKPFAEDKEMSYFVKGRTDKQGNFAKYMSEEELRSTFGDEFADIVITNATEEMRFLSSPEEDPNDELAKLLREFTFDEDGITVKFKNRFLPREFALTKTTGQDTDTLYKSGTSPRNILEEFAKDMARQDPEHIANNTAMEEAMQKVGKINPAPFDDANKYIEVMVKRLILWAVHNGHERVAWTPGWLQNERWAGTLRRTVDRINIKTLDEITDETDGTAPRFNEEGVWMAMYHGGSNLGDFMMERGGGKASVYVDGEKFVFMTKEQLASLTTSELAEQVMAKAKEPVEPEITELPEGYEVKLEPEWTSLEEENLQHNIKEYDRLRNLKAQAEDRGDTGRAGEYAAQADFHAQRIRELRVEKEELSQKGDWTLYKNGERYRDSDGRNAFGRTKEEGVAAAIKFLNRERGAGKRVIQGKDIVFEGKGMLLIYDKLTRNIASNIVKKFGSKVETTDFRVSQKHEPPEGLGKPGELKTFSFAITDEMRKSVADGLPLFQGERGYTETALPFDTEDFAGRLRKMVIGFTERANPTTAPHEMAHIGVAMHRYFAQLARQAIIDGNEDPEVRRIADDWQKLKEYIGAESDIFTREQEEKVALAFEDYLMKGEAPSDDLRAIFSRFRKWFMDLYGGIRRAGVEVNPKIAEVFDRWLASDEQIARVKEGNNGIAAIAAALGLPPDIVDKVSQYVTSSIMQAEEKLFKELTAEQKAKESEAYQKEFDKLKPEVEEELKTKREYTVMEYLKEQGLKFLMGPETEGLAPELVTEGDDFVHPDDVAELMGYDSGKQMLRALRDTAPLDKAVAYEVRRRLTAKYPEMAKAGKLRSKAASLVMNDRVVLALDTLIKELGKATGGKTKGMRAFAQQVAQQHLDRIKAEESDYLFRYEVQRDKSIREALKAARAGVPQEALIHLQRAMVNQAIYKGLEEFNEVKQKAKELFAKVNRKDKKLAGGIDIDFVGAARWVLAQHGFAVRDDFKLSDFMRDLNEMDPDAKDYLVGLAMGASAAEDNIKPEDLTIPQFLTLYDGIVNIIAEGRKQKEFAIGIKRVRAEKAEQELLLQMGDDPEKLPPLPEGTEVTGKNWLRSKVSTAKAQIRRVELWCLAMDGNDPNGPFTKYIFKPLKKAEDAYKKDREKWLGGYAAILKRHKPLLRRRSKIPTEMVRRDRTGREEKMVFNDDMQLIGFLLHTGNESNLDKLLGGYGIDPAEYLAFIHRAEADGTITKEHRDLVQELWDYAEKLKPLMQRAHKQLYGFKVQEIPAKAIDSKFGLYRGGYWPAIVDPDQAEDAKTLEQMLEQSKQYMAGTVNRGFTHERKEGYKQPLKTDLRLGSNHVDQVLRFIHLEPAARDMTRIINRRDFRARLHARDPDAYMGMLRPFLSRYVTQSMEPAPVAGDKGAAMSRRAWSWLRRSATMQLIAYSATVAVQNVANMPVAMWLKPRAFARGLAMMTAHPIDSFREMIEASPQMRERLTTNHVKIGQDIDFIAGRRWKASQAKDFLIRHGYILMRGIDSYLSGIVWSGAYSEEMAKHGIHEDAVYAADSYVRKVMGSSSSADVSKIEASHPMVKAIMPFYSFFNAQANLMMTEFGDIGRKYGWAGTPKMLLAYVMLVAAPAMIGQVIVDGLRGNLPDDDDDDGILDDWLAYFMVTNLRYVGAGVPVAGQGVNAVINATNKNPMDDRLSISPIVSAIDTGVSLGGKLFSDKDVDDATLIRQVMATLGFATGIPLGQIGKSIGYAAGVQSGEIDPDNPLEYAAGLVAGKPKKK